MIVEPAFKDKSPARNYLENGLFKEKVQKLTLCA